MNKIKIVNQEILHLMQTTAKEFRAGDEGMRERYPGYRRPRTPQQVFKSVLRDGACQDLRLKKKQRIKTTQMHQGSFIGMKVSTAGSRIRPESPNVIERKIQLAESPKQRPNTAYLYGRNLKIKTEKMHEKQDNIIGLKQDINSVLREISQQSQLSKKRMKARYTEYGMKKFGKFWNNHRVSLGKRTTATGWSSSINMNNEILPKQNVFKITQF